MSVNDSIRAMRGGSRLRRQWRRALFVVMAAAVLVPVTTLIGNGGAASGGTITTPPFEIPDKGTLTITTTKTVSTTANTIAQRDSVANGSGVLATQTFGPSNCVLTTTPTLLGFATTKGVPGMFSGNIGDKDKPGNCGTGSGLVENTGTLGLSLGSSIADLEISHFALDIETRKNVKITLTAKLDGALTSTYELRSGTSIVAGQGSTTPGSAIFNCNSQSSSNPNSGDSDNCRWNGDVLADQLTLTSTLGEFALNGGSDGGASQPSVLTLTDIDGLLDCQSQPNNGEFTLSEGGGGTPEVGIIRLDNLDPDEACELIPVDLQTSSSGGVNEVQFLKDLTSQTSSAFTTDTTWPLEGAQNPPPATQFEFVDGNPFDLEFCLGTPVYDTNDNFLGIAELLNTDPGDDSVVPDLEPSLDGRQYACYYFQTQQLVDDGTISLFQQSYVIGDYTSRR
jgi:hypothetical protein